MKSTLTNPRSAAIAGLLLALPGALLLSLLVLGIQPPLGPLDGLLTAPPGQPAVLGTAVALTLIVVLPAVAFLLNIAPVVRNVQAGNGIAAHPANLLLAGVALCSLALFAAAIIVDQYPCWIGVPNCD